MTKISDKSWTKKDFKIDWRGIDFGKKYSICWYDPIDLKQNRRVGLEYWELPDCKYYFILFGIFGMYWRTLCNNK